MSCYRPIKQLIPNSTVNKLMEMRILLTQWRTKGYIDQSTYKKLYISDRDLSKSYGYSKVHKDGYPLRMIVSCINSPLFNLSTFLKDLLIKAIKKNVNYIKNRFNLVKKINSMPLLENYQIVSFDTSTYSNIPNDLTLKNVLKRWDSICNNTTIPFHASLN